MTIKRFWDKTIEYNRIMEIMEDYWLTEPEEDFVQVKMAFIKGSEFQTKRIAWRRNPPKGKPKVDLVHFSDALRIMESIESGLDEFVKAKSEELQIDEREVWENIEYHADMYFINRKMKAIEENDED
jgi:hypothetical protein